MAPDQSAAFAADVHPRLVDGSLLDRFGDRLAEMPQSELVGTAVLLLHAYERWPGLTIAELVRSMHLMAEVGEMDSSLS